MFPLLEEGSKPLKLGKHLQVWMFPIFRVVWEKLQPSLQDFWDAGSPISLRSSDLGHQAGSTGP